MKNKYIVPEILFTPCPAADIIASSPGLNLESEGNGLTFDW